VSEGGGRETGRKRDDEFVSEIIKAGDV